jgi:hypothetical protein
MKAVTYATNPRAESTIFGDVNKGEQSLVQSLSSAAWHEQAANMIGSNIKHNQQNRSSNPISKF